MSIQAEYIDDMCKYKQQVEVYNLAEDVRLRGISRIDDTDMQMAHFSYMGEVWKLIMHKNDDLDSAIKKRISEIKEMYYEEADTTQTEQV